MTLDAATANERALFGVACIASGLMLAPLAIAIARRSFGGRQVFFARWGFSHAVWVFALVFLSGAAAQYALAALAPQMHDAERNRLASLAGFVLGCAAVLALAARKDPRGMLCLGLEPERHLAAVGLGIFSYLVAVPTLFGAGLVWPWVIEHCGGTYAPQRVAVELVGLDGRAFWTAALCAACVQPLCEELLFRAFLQPLLVQNLGDRGGVVLTSICFASLHGANAFLPVFVLSSVLGMLMLRTQRLGAVWVAHALHNSIVIALLVASPAARDLLGQRVDPALLEFFRP